jgi:hypothetical protein
MSDTCVGSFVSISASTISVGRIIRWKKIRQKPRANQLSELGKIVAAPFVDRQHHRYVSSTSLNNLVENADRGVAIQFSGWTSS